MAKLPKKAESLISVFILVLSVCICGLLFHKYIYSSWFPESVPKAVNNQIFLPDVDWSEQPKTLVLALQASCHFCNESAPFYKRLIEGVKGQNIRLIAVLPGDVTESRAHLDKLGLTNLDVRQMSLDSLQVEGTPTLILVNENGEITSYWVGKLPADKEAEVISKLISDS